MRSNWGHRGLVFNPVPRPRSARARTVYKQAEADDASASSQSGCVYMEDPTWSVVSSLVVVVGHHKTSMSGLFQGCPRAGKERLVDLHLLQGSNITREFAPCAHHVRYLNNVSRNGAPLKPL